MTKSLVFILSACLLLAGCQSSENHYDQVSARIAELKAASEAAPAGSNIKIVVNILTTSLTHYSAVTPVWRYVHQNIRIARRPDVFARSGLKVGLAGEGFHARLDIIKRRLKSSEDSELFIVVADGLPGYISIGREISVPRFYYFGRWYTAVDYQFRQAGRSLKVTAHRLPSGLIDMELTPVFSRFLTTGGDIELTELSTRLTAPPGRTIVLGQTDTAEQNVAAALFSYRRGSKKTQTLITVTPYFH